MKKRLISSVVAAALIIGSSVGTGIGKVDNLLNVNDTTLSASAICDYPNGLYYVKKTFSVKVSQNRFNTRWKTYTYNKGTYVSVSNCRINGSVDVYTQLDNGTLQFVRG